MYQFFIIAPSLLFLLSSELRASQYQVCTKSFKQTFVKLSEEKKLLNYNPNYQVSKFFAVNMLGLAISGWPLWQFPKLQMLYSESLSREEKLEIEKLVKTKAKFTKELLPRRKLLKRIETWDRVRKSWVLFLGVITSGLVLDSVVPIELFIQGKSGLVSYKLEKIESIYKEDLNIILENEMSQRIELRELEKSYSRLLMEIYKDNLVKKEKKNEN